MKKVNDCSVSMKKISSGLAVRYFERKSSCYFYHDKIYLLHKHFHEFSLEGLCKT